MDVDASGRTHHSGPDRLPEWLLGVLAVPIVVAGAWAASNVYRARRAPNVSDIDGEFFDPHGYISLVSLGILAVALGALPTVLAMLVGIRCQRLGVAAKPTVCAVLAAGGVLWCAAGVAAVCLDVATADVFDPMIGGVKGRSVLTPLGWFMAVAGGLTASGFALARKRPVERAMGPSQP